MKSSLVEPFCSNFHLACVTLTLIYRFYYIFYLYLRSLFVIPKLTKYVLIWFFNTRSTDSVSTTQLHTRNIPQQLGDISHVLGLFTYPALIHEIAEIPLVEFILSNGDGGVLEWYDRPSRRSWLSGRLCWLARSSAGSFDVICLSAHRNITVTAAVCLHRWFHLHESLAWQPGEDSEKASVRIKVMNKAQVCIT